MLKPFLLIGTPGDPSPSRAKKALVTWMRNFRFSRKMAMQILNGSTSPLALFITFKVKKVSPCTR
ncbi:hypothetical protein D3C78_1911530 [compost metagenome]